MLPSVLFLGLLFTSAAVAWGGSQDTHPLAAASPITTTQSCDSLCSCEEKDGVLHINCEQRNISRISQVNVPQGVPFHLNLYKNDLAELRLEEMESLRSALSLHLGANSIQELEPGVFSALGSLRKLHINSNFLVTLKEDTFQGLVNLEFLQADTNFIQLVEPGAFNKLIRLKVLILNDNAIEFLPGNIFRFLPLTHLDLRGNKLQTLPYVGFLEHIGRIMELLLEDNNWHCNCDILHLKIWMENMRAQSAIGEVVCSEPPQLKGTILAKVKRDVLCKSHADINLEEPSKSLDMVVTPSSKAVPPQLPRLLDNDGGRGGVQGGPTPSNIPGSPCVEHCSCHNHPVAGFLMHCQDRGIQRVSDIGILEQSPTKLVMTGNMIQRLLKYDFVTYDGLELLNLANNRIDYVDNETFLSLSSLRKLYLNGNRLERLVSTMFVGLHNLEYLYLEYNLLVEIAPGAFNPLPNLKLLSLSNNQLASLPAQIFRSVPQLAKLNLRKNLLMHLPVSNVLDQLGSLEQIYLEENPWDCSCDLLSLKQWVEKLRPGTVVGSLLCHTPRKVLDTDLRSLRHDALCPGLVTYHSLSPGDSAESVTGPTLGPENSAMAGAGGGGILDSLTDTIPLSVLILSLLVVFLMLIFCSAGAVVFVVHRRRRRAKRKMAEEGGHGHGQGPRESGGGGGLGMGLGGGMTGSPIHLHYSMYGQKTTHHTLHHAASPAAATLYEERAAAHSPIVQICRNPTYCAQHKEHGGGAADAFDGDYGLELGGFGGLGGKQHVCRSIMEKENTSPLTGHPKFRSSVGGECPGLPQQPEFLSLGDPGALYRNILEKEKELQQLGITEYLRKNMPQALQTAVGEMQVPLTSTSPTSAATTTTTTARQEELKLMEALVYTRPRKVTLEQTKNEYFELKANLHTEPDYLEVLEHQTAFN